MKIRKANLEDARKVADLVIDLAEFESAITPEIYALDPGKRGLFLRYLRQHINNKKSLVLVVEDQGELAGFLFARLKNWSHVYRLKKTIELELIFIRQKYRRKGLAKKLIKEAIRHYKGTRIKHITLGVVAANIEAKKAYKTLGFRPYYERYFLKIS